MGLKFNRSNSMKILSFFIFIFCIGFYSCQKNNKVKEIPTYKIPIVLDTLKENLEKRNVFSLQTADYKCLYLGENRDTIYACLPNPDDAYPEEVTNYHSDPKTEDVVIYIDTTKIISNHTYLLEQNSNEFYTKKYQAFPVILFNKGKDSLTVGNGNHLRLILEARNKSGKWMPIEEKYVYMCGTFLRFITVPPNQIAITSVPIDSGNFKTKLRLRFNDILSYEFSGSINQSQFLMH